MTKPSSWTVDDVASKLSELGFSKYTSAFKSNKVTGAALPLLTDRHLKELGVTSVGDRLRLLKFFQDIPSGPVTAAKMPSKPAPAATPKASPSPAAAPPPSPGGDSGSASKDWEKKRRQMMMKKMQAEREEDPGDAFEPPKQISKPKPSPSAARASPARNSRQDIDDSPPPPPKRQEKPRSSARRAPPPPPPEDDGNDDRRACAYCGRKFASDRIDKHEEVCARSHAKKTKVFDSKKQRLQGTEAAQFARNPSKDPPKKPKSNFRQQHEKLVESLRAARKYQAYEKAKEEGRAVGPPPEIPKYEIENDDRVACPYCGRKFGEEAAKRHIAVCERMGGGGGGGRAARGGARGRGRR